jgi:[ribosomal protein S5]-alanine N-acetyltransferase
VSTLPERLHGSKVWLRRFTEGDITDTYVSWLNDPVVTRFSNQRFHRHDAASCRRYLESFEGGPNLFLSVHCLSGDEAIGTMTAYINPHHGTADVGILLGRSAWGGGFGQDAWNTLADWLLARPDIRKMTAGTLATNTAMIRVAERAGMALEGRRIRQEVFEGAEVDILYFAKFADDR